MATAQRQPEPLHTQEEYLALEREADFKSEYLNGRIYAMSGGSPEHSTISVNVTAALAVQLRGQPCQAYDKDMKVQNEAGTLYSYPDLSIVYGEPQFHDQRRDVLTNPVVLIEVLSPSTEAFDRGKKFVQYQQIVSLTDYILISQHEPRIDHYIREGENDWHLTIVRGLDASLSIASINCTLALSEVYDRVSFPEPRPSRPRGARKSQRQDKSTRN